MKGYTLVLETAGPSCQVGLLKEGQVVGGVRWDWPRQHSEKLILLVQEVLEEAQLSWEGISGVVYHQGPGSHTGLRIGLAAVKAWALSLGWQVYPVPLLHVLKHLGGPWAGEKALFCGWEARPGEWYGQLWRGSVPLTLPLVLPQADWLAQLPTDLVFVGNIRLPGREGLYLSEVSWQAVAAAAASLSPLHEPTDIIALTPLYFRPFVPTQRRSSAG